MPAWIHDRAEHLLAKNPSMRKSTAFALATQQSHRLGKSPRGYGTAQGKREAKAKYDAPKKEYTKTPNPGNLESPKLAYDTSDTFYDPQSRSFRTLYATNQGVARLPKHLAASSSPVEGASEGTVQAVEDAVLNDAVKQEMRAKYLRQKSKSKGWFGRPLLGKRKKDRYDTASEALTALDAPKTAASYREEETKERMKKAFAASPYSRSTGSKWMRYTSRIPPFQAPPVKTGGPPSKCKKASALSPATRLAQTQQVGLPKTTAPPGKSIGQLSKPQGFGKILPGLSKS